MNGLMGNQPMMPQGMGQTLPAPQEDELAALLQQGQGSANELMSAIQPEPEMGEEDVEDAIYESLEMAQEAGVTDKEMELLTAVADELGEDFPVWIEDYLNVHYADKISEMDEEGLGEEDLDEEGF